MDLRSIHVNTSERTLVSISNFAVPENHIMFLFGESGIGKSLIAKALFGILDTTTLVVRVNNLPNEQYLQTQKAAQIRENGFFVFQEPSSHLNPLMRIEEQLREGSLFDTAGETEIFNELWEGPSRKMVDGLLSLYPKPNRPSGGEKQRMLLAMAFKKIRTVKNGGLFVFDEPTGNLDDAARNRFLSFLSREFEKRRFTALVITHDYSMVSAAMNCEEPVRRNIAFRELSRDGHNVILRDFSPAMYTSWLLAQKAVRNATTSNAPAVVNLESGVTALGHTLRVFRDPGLKDECGLRVSRGRMTYLKAPSGTGKTTLVKSMMGLVPVRNLRLQLPGVSLSERTPESYWRKTILGRKISMVFQHADESLNMQARADEVFDGLPLSREKKTKDRLEFLSLLFEEKEIEHIRSRKIFTLSGGQKQKLNLLRSLILDTSCLILDEPLNGLDFQSVGRVLELLDKKRLEGRGILVISHNEEIFDTQADDMYYLQSESSVRN